MSGHENALLRPRLETFVVTADVALLDAAAGLDYLVQHSFSATDEAWVQALRDLDARIFHGTALSLPSWALYDCALAPGFVVGLARPTATARGRGDVGALAAYQPLSLAMVIPTAAGDVQLVHTLGALDEAGWGEADLLAKTWARVIELSQYPPQARPPSLIATSAWDSPTAALYLGQGPLALLTAWMPAHDHPRTGVFGIGARFQNIPANSEHKLVRCDAAGLAALQGELDGGAECWVVGSETILRDGVTHIEVAIARDRERTL